MNKTWEIYFKYIIIFNDRVTENICIVALFDLLINFFVINYSGEKSN